MKRDKALKPSKSIEVKGSVEVRLRETLKKNRVTLDVSSASK